MLFSLRGKARLLLAGFLAIFYCGIGFADSWQTGQFLKSLEDRNLDFPFWRQGLESISGIDFNNTYSNQYRPFTNRLGLEQSMSDGADRLLPFDEMSRIDLGTLAHESWHAYFANFISQRPEYKSIYNEFKLRARSLYWDLPAEKAYQALEEAYAVFIGNTITQVRWVDWSVHHYENQDEVDCDKARSFLQRMWENNWHAEVFGYYYRDSVSEYWEDQMKSAWAWLSGDDSARPPREGLIFVEKSLGESDRQWISSRLFGGLLKQSFQDSAIAGDFCENFSY